MFETRKDLLNRLNEAEAGKAQADSEIQTLNNRLAEAAELTNELAVTKEELDSTKLELEATKEDLSAAQAELEPEAIAKLIRDEAGAEAQSPIKDAVAALVTEEVTKAGHAPVEVEFEPKGDKKEIDPSLTGIDRTAAALKAKRK